MKAIAIIPLLLIAGPWLRGAYAGSIAAANVGMNERALFEVAGSLYGIDPNLLAAIATAESNNNPAAESGKGARGLMQLMPLTAEQFSVSDPFDPVQNVLGAARFLDYLRKRIPNDLPEALAAYNAGEGAVRAHHGIPPFPETRRYVREVLWLYLLGTVPNTQFTVTQMRGAVSPEPKVESIRHGVNDGDNQVLGQLDVIRQDRAAAIQHQ